MMACIIACQLLDVKTNREYHLKLGRQLIGRKNIDMCEGAPVPRLYFWISVASKNYSGPEDVDLMLACDDNVTPFLVELSVKKQSARLTCIVGCCVAKSIGVGPGGSIKLKNGSIKIIYIVIIYNWSRLFSCHRHYCRVW